MYTNRKQELKKKALLEGILQTQIVGMRMKGLTGSSYGKLQRLSSFKRTVPETTGVIQFKSICPHYYYYTKTSMIKFYITKTMPVVVTSKVLQNKAL